MAPALEVTVDPALQGAVTGFLASSGPWWALGVLTIIMSPKIIPAISAAIAEQRKVTHKRQENLRKIQNNAAQRGVSPPTRHNRRP